MLFSSFCPKCGKMKRYLAEEIGKLGHCLNCGQSFTLKDNPKESSKHLATAAVVVIGSIVLFGGAIYVRAQFNTTALELHDRLAEVERQADTFNEKDID